MDILVRVSIPHSPPRVDTISLSDLGLTKEEWILMEYEEQMSAINDYVENYDPEYWQADSYSVV